MSTFVEALNTEDADLCTNMNLTVLKKARLEKWSDPLLLHNLLAEDTVKLDSVLKREPIPYKIFEKQTSQPQDKTAKLSSEHSALSTSNTSQSIQVGSLWQQIASVAFELSAAKASNLELKKKAKWQQSFECALPLLQQNIAEVCLDCKQRKEAHCTQIEDSQQKKNQQQDSITLLTVCLTTVL